MGDWSIKYGYQDAKPYYSADSPKNGEIHLLVTTKEEGAVWICGSLGTAEFYLEEITDLEKFNGPSYKPDVSNRVTWTKKKDFGNECKILHDLSPGVFVISVANTGDKAITLTHVISWMTKSKWSTAG